MMVPVSERKEAEMTAVSPDRGEGADGGGGGEAELGVETGPVVDATGESVHAEVGPAVGVGVGPTTVVKIGRRRGVVVAERHDGRAGGADNED